MVETSELWKEREKIQMNPTVRLGEHSLGRPLVKCFDHLKLLLLLLKIQLTY